MFSRRNACRAIVPGVLVSILAACSGSDGKDGTSCSVQETDAGATISCDDGTEATLNHGEEGKRGTQGDDGISALIRVHAESAGENCATGGQRLQVGLDDGAGDGDPGDGELDDDEVDTTQYVCDGAAGAVALVDVTREQPGDNCAAGGQKLQSGLDNGGGDGTANNGELEAGEVTSTTYVCDGVDGQAGVQNLVPGYTSIVAERGGYRVQCREWGTGMGGNTVCVEGWIQLKASDVTDAAAVPHCIDDTTSLRPMWWGDPADQAATFCWIGTGSTDVTSTATEGKEAKLTGWVYMTGTISCSADKSVSELTIPNVGAQIWSIEATTSERTGTFLEVGCDAW